MRLASSVWLSPAAAGMSWRRGDSRVLWVASELHREANTTGRVNSSPQKKCRRRLKNGCNSWFMETVSWTLPRSEVWALLGLTSLLCILHPKANNQLNATIRVGARWVTTRERAIPPLFMVTVNNIPTKRCRPCTIRASSIQTFFHLQVLLVRSVVPRPLIYRLEVLGHSVAALPKKKISRVRGYCTKMGYLQIVELLSWSILKIPFGINDING